MVNRYLAMTVALATGLSLITARAQAPQAAPAAVPADGITMDMMPITSDQLKGCRDQASQQLADEQKTLHGREHAQDNDKMKQGAVTGATGAITSAISRKNNGYWWNHNNNGAETAAATGATQRTERNSDNVASTTEMSQVVGTDAYKQCINGIKGPEYIQFRQSGRMPSPGSVPASNMQAEVAAPAATPAPAVAAKPTIVDEGDGKHVALTMPGQTDAMELTRTPTNKNMYIDEATGDKYLVATDGSVTKIAHKAKAAQ